MYLHVICGISKQTAKGDGIGYSAQIDKQNSRQGLDVQGIIKITCKERQLSLNIQTQTATKPEKRKTDSKREIKKE